MDLGLLERGSNAKRRREGARSAVSPAVGARETCCFSHLMTTVSREKRRTARGSRRPTRRSEAARRRIPRLNQAAPVARRAMRSDRRT